MTNSNSDEKQFVTKEELKASLDTLSGEIGRTLTDNENRITREIEEKLTTFFIVKISRLDTQIRVMNLRIKDLEKALDMNKNNN
jgi:hypothetical protein